MIIILIFPSNVKQWPQIGRPCHKKRQVTLSRMRIIFLVMKMKRSKTLLIAVLLAMIAPALLLRGTTTAPVVQETLPITTAPVAKERTILVLEEDEIKKMSLDTYLVSVVLSEMPASFSEEALKAQAVVARTYALRRVTKGSKHAPAAVCLSSGCCQGYTTEQAYLANGGSFSNVQKIKDAVKSTRDLVLLYEGKLIDATYFSSSGGQTEDAVAVWGADVPYLQSTDSPGEEIAAHYTDTVQLSVKAFLQKLGIAKQTAVIESVT